METNKSMSGTHSQHQKIKDKAELLRTEICDTLHEHIEDKILLISLITKVHMYGYLMWSDGYSDSGLIHNEKLYNKRMDKLAEDEQDEVADDEKEFDDFDDYIDHHSDLVNRAHEASEGMER